ncbi:hypothetical protein [Arthrobacter rhombi]|uniref:hypothetical protein n=1 Tax=Arthrobacter rhombi TaxID=71253 RepID=UPI003FD099C1
MSRTYVITGAGSGIGAATAQLLRERGETVIGVDLKGAEIDADLSTPEGRTSGVERAIDLAEGRIDAVIACAGISMPQPLTVKVNYFGVTEFLDQLAPTLATSESPEPSSSAPWPRCSPTHPSSSKHYSPGMRIAPWTSVPPWPRPAPSRAT